MRNQTILKSGETCTMNGLWRTENPPHTTIRILKDDIMPNFRDKIVNWKMIQHLPVK